MGRRFVRWSPEEMALWLKDGARPRQVLLSDRIPADATVVDVRPAPDQRDVLVIALDSKEWDTPVPRNVECWKKLELKVRWGQPPDPTGSLRKCAEAFVAYNLFTRHLEACPSCDEFKRCEKGADLGVAWIVERTKAEDGLVELKALREA